MNAIPLQLFAQERNYIKSTRVYKCYNAKVIVVVPDYSTFYLQKKKKKKKKHM